MGCPFNPLGQDRLVIAQAPIRLFCNGLFKSGRVPTTPAIARTSGSLRIPRFRDDEMSRLRRVCKWSRLASRPRDSPRSVLLTQSNIESLVGGYSAKPVWETTTVPSQQWSDRLLTAKSSSSCPPRVIRASTVRQIPSPGRKSVRIRVKVLSSGRRWRSADSRRSEPAEPHRTSVATRIQAPPGPQRRPSADVA